MAFVHKSMFGVCAFLFIATSFNLPEKSAIFTKLFLFIVITVGLTKQSVFRLLFTNARTIRRFNPLPLGPKSMLRLEGPSVVKLVLLFLVLPLLNIFISLLRSLLEIFIGDLRNHYWRLMILFSVISSYRL